MSRRIALVVAFGLVACGEAEPPPASPHLSEAATRELREVGFEEYRGKAKIASEDFDGRTTSVIFDPSSGPMCLFGLPYRAYLQDNGSDQLLVFLGGGGACWTGFCSATPLPDEGILPLGPLHVEVSSNPMKGFNVLYLPYCDGSVFAGDNDVPHPEGERHFHGRQNLSAGLDLLDRLGDIRTVVVGGVSAGSYGTLFASALLRLRYPTADLFVYADSGVWIQNLERTADVEARINDWRFAELLPPSCTDCMGGRAQLTTFMHWLLQNDDQLTIGMLSYYRDSVIGDNFTKLSGAAYKELLLAETGKLHDAFPDRARRFMLDGTAHVLTLYWPNLIKVNGVGLRDWTGAMIHGGPEWQDLLEP